MSNSFFRFKQFTINQDRCAMKVGTDGTLLGAWAKGGKRMLDVGTGTGLIAMMIAQRFSSAYITAIDIDADACTQARENAEASPFGNRIKVIETALQDFCSETYDSIICNPPFFTDSLECPDEKRTQARHTSSLTYNELFRNVSRLLTDDGSFSAIIPFDCRNDFEANAIIAGFSIKRTLAVKTTIKKSPRRYLYEFTKCPCNDVKQEEMVIGSPEYNDLVKDFYLFI